jgi:hypothetical protein
VGEYTHPTRAIGKTGAVKALMTGGNPADYL